MGSKPGFCNYVAAAFNARPWGMFVAPNWVGVAAFGLLGVTNPGFWVLGAGLELGYLLTLATSRRFQRTVTARPLMQAQAEWNSRIQGLISRLGDSDRTRYTALAERCRSIIDLQTHGGVDAPQGLEAQADSMGRLSWMFLRLLVARRSIVTVVSEGETGDALDRRIASLQRQADDESVSGDLRRSLSGQIDILSQRISQREDA